MNDPDHSERLELVTDLLTARQAAYIAGVSAAAIRQWVSRDYLSIAKLPDGTECRNESGHPLYWRIDVAKAEYRTRKRARRAA